MVDRETNLSVADAIRCVRGSCNESYTFFANGGDIPHSYKILRIYRPNELEEGLRVTLEECGTELEHIVDVPLETRIFSELSVIHPNGQESFYNRKQNDPVYLNPK